MTAELTSAFLSLLFAWVAGMLVGLERSVNGRAAGFRTHALVSLASAIVMMAARLPQLAPELVAAGSPLLVESSRLIQGVMTGVGFLGAGVIFKEGVSIQGLTTAAAIWSSAAFGALFGLGLWFPGLMSTGLVLATLTLLRWVEQRLSGNVYALGVFQFAAGSEGAEAHLTHLLKAHGVEFDDRSYALRSPGGVLEYSGVLRAGRRDGLQRLVSEVGGAPGLVGYTITRISK